MRKWHHALRHEGGGRRQVEPLYEFHYGVGGVLPDDAVTHQYQGRRGLVNQPRDLFDLALRRVRYRGCLNLERREVLSGRSEEHTSELQSRRDLVCRLLLE